MYNLSSLSITTGSTDNGYVGCYAKNVYTSESDSSNLTTQDGYIFYNDSGTYYLMGYTGSATALKLPTLTINSETISYSIYKYAFYRNTDITSITISDSVTSIGNMVFYNCTSLTSITIGDSVTSIGEYAFYNCTSLISITIPDSVTSIGSYAFYECSKLVEVYNLSSLTITVRSASYGYVAKYAKNVYTSERGSSNLTTQDGYIFYNDNGSYYLMGYTGSDTELTLPTLTINSETVSYSIYKYAFYKNTDITSITISDSVTSIGSNAFWNCTSLKSVYYSGTASQWASISFGNRDANPLSYAGSLYLNGTLITDITIETITSINSYAFYNCTSLTSIIIPNSVTSIGNSVFYNCTSLTSIIIPYGVTSIDYWVFYNCTSLTSVYYTGTADEWTAITFGDSSYSDPTYYGATLYYYSEEEPDYTDGYNYWHYVNGEVVIWTVEE